ncbi:hypothetical protein PYCCODRAFT_1472180 [Trametes coccinea BRFM310]|uniref:Uncharacterized protein n=1 Tax=Trametes coccinea (strain BRFM310) TaxID=1353009 RepID=A0A1Y2IAQ0_TRAC3|nr:hypothetical protein PYCCODRAFT_1472180 [Trametes coccinea BRFM310]
MVTFTVIIASAAANGGRLGTMASKVKSTFSKLSKPGVIRANSNRLRRRLARQEIRKRTPRQSLPRTLDPLPEDLCVPLLTQFEDGLSRLHGNANMISNDSHSSHDTESTLVDSDSEDLKKDVVDCVVRAKAVDELKVAKCLPTEAELNYDAVNDIFYAREEADPSELALFEIKVVSKVVLPQEDYYSAEGLVPADGYEVSLEIQ